MTENINKMPKNHNTRNGVLWILSPFIALFGVLFINIIVRFAGIQSPIINIISLLGGMAGVILIVVGPVIGIVKLVRN